MCGEKVSYNKGNSYFYEHPEFSKDQITFDVKIKEEIHAIHATIIYCLESGKITLKCYYYKTVKTAEDKMIAALLDKEKKRIEMFLLALLKVRILKEIARETDRVKWITEGKVLLLNGEKIDLTPKKELDAYLEEKENDEEVYPFLQMVEKLTSDFVAKCVYHPTKKGEKIKNISGVGIVWENSGKPLKLKENILKSEWILEKNA